MTADAVAAVLATLLFAGAARLVAGPGLGALIGGLVAVIAPAAFAGTGRIRAWVSLAGVVVAVAAVWLTAGLSAGEYAGVVCVITAVAAAAGALAWSISGRGVRPTPGFAIATLLAVAWVGWPVWLGRALVGAPQGVVQALVAAHPLFAINRAAARFGMWGERSVAYGLTNLGQDVPYAMPASVWPCVTAHAAVAAALIVITIVARKAASSRRRPPPTAPSPAA